MKPARKPSVANVFLHLWDSTELQHCHPMGFGLAQAFAHQVLCAAVEMVTELAIQILLHTPAIETKQIDQLSHGLPGLLENQPDCFSEAVPAVLFDC